MTKTQLAELKTIADNFKAMPVQMTARFERLLREISQADRRDLAATLQAMIANCNK